MGQLLPIILILVIFAVLAPVLKALTAKGKAPAEYPYQKEPTLFTPAERSFLGVLEQAVGDQFRIMGKVRLADVIRVRPGLTASARQKALNKIQSKHLDFVACDPNDLSIQFAVELDDKSHGKKGRQDRDVFLDAAMNAAGVPLIRFPARKAYSIHEVFDKLASTLNPPGSDPATEDPQPQPVEIDTASDAPSEPATNLCPSCGGDMVRRKASKGKNAGQEFWGCSNYPKCRKILPV
ncbi:MAG: DUF2726 domain-containing protein [Lentisphaerae bacterium]|nr:DUF2726 domain-containing protein [Lentisphaerota bacterium]